MVVLSCFIVILLFFMLDFRVFNKTPWYVHKEVSKWTVIWVSISFVFGVIYWLYALYCQPDDLKPTVRHMKFITG
jgi:hypothetical protein